MDFSSDEEEEDAGRSRTGQAVTSAKPSTSSVKTPPPTTALKRVQLSDSEDYGVGSSDDESSTTHARQATQEESGNEETDQPRVQPVDAVNEQRTATATPSPAPGRPPVSTVVTVPRSVDSSVGEDDEEVASFMDESEDGGGDPPPFTSTAALAGASDRRSFVPLPQTAKAIPIAHNDSLASRSAEEDESASNKSDYLESFDGDGDDEEGTRRARPTASQRTHSAASESGVYESDGFDDESDVAPPAIAPAGSAPLVAPYEDAATGGPTFDYSMDFSDDNVEGKLTDAPPLPALETPTSANASHHQNESDYLESEASDTSEHVVDASANVTAQSELTQQRSGKDSDLLALQVSGPAAANANQWFAAQLPNTSSILSDVNHDDATLATETVEQHVRLAPLPPISAARDAPVWSALQQTEAPASSHTVSTTTTTTRSRVRIVREYELPPRERVEMKDASTQFTGNHAGVQADMTPDGMHSLLVTPPRLGSQHATLSSIPSDPSNSPAVCDAVPPPSPPLPPVPPLSSSGYSVDALRLPSATTTSIYKQQLLALQEQIQTKKRETERLVHERMTFQYSSLRGTERVRCLVAVCSWLSRV